MKDGIIQIIDEGKLTPDILFVLAKECTRLLASGEGADEQDARRIVIHILNRWASIPPELYPIWTDLVEALGFYPYLEKNINTMRLDSLSDVIRKESYSSQYLSSTYLHREQKVLSDILLSKKNVIASAPTSFGKSLLIEEVVASQKYNNIVVIQPTLALLEETRRKLKKYSNLYKIIVRTSQPYSHEKGNLFLLTAERVLEYEDLPKIDLLVVDEFYKLSPRRNDKRAVILNNAFIKIVDNFDSKFYLLGPNIDSITPGFAQKYNAEFYRSDFSLVDCLIKDVYSASARKKDKENALFNLLDELRRKGEQTLVYCSGPSRARSLAKKYIEHLSKEEERPRVRVPLIDWIAENISKQWSLVACLRNGLAFHDGSLPKHIAASIIDYFNDKRLNCIFCTTTIIEGVNTSAKNVVIFDNKKGDLPIDYFDYCNIKGRSGRLMEHYVGNLYNFTEVPKNESIVIDIPFIEQNPSTLSDEILINIRRKDLKEPVKERYDKITGIGPELLNVVRKNGVSIEGQIKIYKQLLHDVAIPTEYKRIAWSRMPEWESLLYVLNIATKVIPLIGNSAVSSVRQLAYFINVYTKGKTAKYLIDKIKEGNKSYSYDQAIEKAFAIYRKYFQFVVPKAFSVVDNLQRLACQQRSKEAGSYSFFINQLQNSFVREDLSILLEFGMPVETVQRVERVIPKQNSEDQLIDYLRNNRDEVYNSLQTYEQERFDRVL